MNVEPIPLPDTDSPEVMTQAVSIWLTHIVWQHLSRYHTDDLEEELLKVYTRVYKSVAEAHKV
jgi:hypothetical protein